MRYRKYIISFFRKLPFGLQVLEVHDLALPGFPVLQLLAVVEDPVEGGHVDAAADVAVEAEQDPDYNQQESADNK